MKKIFTLVMVAMAAMSSYAQQNLFDATDVDADGWIWFDTDEKINKYVGNAEDKMDVNGFDWENYAINPQGKPIQLAYAYVAPDYTTSYANSLIPGTDEAGYMEGQEGYTEGQAKTGSIVLASAGSTMTANGGILLLNLPSCVSINLFMSSEKSFLGRTLMVTPGYNMSQDDSETGADPWTGHTKAIYTKATVFGKLHGAGQFKWEGIESLNNGNNTGVTFKSESSPVYFGFQNCQNSDIYIHGMKVTIAGSTGINNIAADSHVAFEVYSLDGRQQQSMKQGLNIVRHNGVVKKIIK